MMHKKRILWGRDDYTTTPSVCVMMIIMLASCLQNRRRQSLCICLDVQWRQARRHPTFSEEKRSRQNSKERFDKEPFWRCAIRIYMADARRGGDNDGNRSRVQWCGVMMGRRWSHKTIYFVCLHRSFSHFPYINKTWHRRTRIEYIETLDACTLNENMYKGIYVYISR